METFRDIGDKVKVYAAGFKTNLSDAPVIYYLTDDLTPNDLIIKLVDELFRIKYSKTIFYCHNLGRYDIVYIINALHDYNDKYDNQEISHNKFRMVYNHRDNDILSITISKEVNTTTSHKEPKILDTRIAKLVIRDSIPILNSSLSDLSKSYGVETPKGTFPYKFATRNNLFYIGNTPDKFYYNPSLTQSAYDKMVCSNWSFRLETEKYLESDLYSLHQVISKVNKQVFLDYDVNMIDSLTISGLALKIFRGKYYNDNIPLINKTSMYRDIKQSYYGAITEVYKPYGEKLYYYDVNSLYPYVSLQDLPGTTCYKENFINTKKSIESLFGFYYCSVESPKNSYLGLLPVRSKDGLIFPLGKWEGWYFSEELKFAEQNGYKIKVLKGYSFSKSKDVFKRFVNDVYSIKTNPKDNTQKQTAKSILNNLMGRFGIRLEKSVTKVLSGKSFDILSTRKAVISEKYLGNDRYLVTYLPMLDTEILNSWDLDIVKVAGRVSDEEKQNFDVTSVAISAAITAYGRIHISKLKMNVIQMGGNIYYSDTDSLVTDILLPESMVDSKQLGLLKLEHVIIKGIFNNNKTYWLLVRDKNGELMVISKGLGFSSYSINFNDHLNLLLGMDISATKIFSRIEWDKGYVTIDDSKGVIVKGNSYKGRTKVYDFHNLWVDTKPLLINGIDSTQEVSFRSQALNTNSKSLVVYKGLFLVPYKTIREPSYIGKKFLYHKYTLKNSISNRVFSTTASRSLGKSFLYFKFLIMLRTWSCFASDFLVACDFLRFLPQKKKMKKKMKKKNKKKTSWQSNRKNKKEKRNKWVDFLEILSNTFTILLIGLLIFSWIISFLLSEDNHESVSNEDYILNGLDDDLDDDLNDDNTIIELPNACDTVKESDIDNDTSCISEGSAQETESIPNNNLTESIIIRGGFIDSVKDAEDLGLKRLFNEEDDSEKPCINIPSTSTTLISPNGNSIDIPSRSPDNFSPFTPKILDFLKEEKEKEEENEENE